jgi:superfamily II DNA or RNA helicase
MNNNELRSKIQKEAIKAIFNTYNSNYNSFIAVGTGIGKTKIAIDFIKQYCKKINFHANILIVSPTEEIRDNGWKNEFKKWKQLALYQMNCKSICYASLYKELDGYDVVILDEAHHLTEAHSIALSNSKFVLAMTATVPKNEEKINLFKALNFKKSFTYSIDDAIENKIVNDYKITTIGIDPDNQLSIYKAFKTGNATMTEKSKLNQAEQMLYNTDYAVWAINSRMRLIYGSKTKTKKAIEVLNTIPKHLKTLVFCGNIEQAEEILPNVAYHSKNKNSKQLLDDFKSNNIMQLACVEALTEGVNIPNIDVAIITQCQANDRGMIQKMGRLLRSKSTANVYIIYLKGTQDEKWMKKAIESFDKTKITHI